MASSNKDITIKQLYDQLKSDGADVGSEKEFNDWFFRPGKEGYANRKRVFDAFKADGHDVGSTYEEFGSRLGLVPKAPAKPTPTSAAQPAKTTASEVPSAATTATAPAITASAQVSTQTQATPPPASPSAPSPAKGWKPSAKQMAQLHQTVSNATKGLERQAEAGKQRLENMQTYHHQHGTPKIELNPETGKVEQMYYTPAGNKYNQQRLAQMETEAFNEELDQSVNAQLRRARERLIKLRGKFNESTKRVQDKWAADNKMAPATLASDMYVSRQLVDPENSALRVAIRQTEELIKNLEEQEAREKGKDIGFWHGFGRAVGDIRTWDFGANDLADAVTMLHGDKYKRGDATKGEKAAYDDMMEALYYKQLADGVYGGNTSFRERAGNMTGMMLPFMVDFALTMGGFGAIDVATRAAAEGATKLAAKKGLEYTGKSMLKLMADQGIKQGAKQWIKHEAAPWALKALGTTIDDLAIRAPLMTNTVQAGKTASDIIERKLGDVVEDAKGNLQFANDKSWSGAVWQGEANAIIENYSEMFGGHLPSGAWGDVAKVFGAKRLSGILSKASNSDFGKIISGTSGFVKKNLGISDYAGEVTEEYYGQLWRTALNLDDAYQINPDGTRTNLLATEQFHGDIWGGMALSMGLIGAGKVSASGAKYVNRKHAVTKADRHAADIFGDQWTSMKDIIDNTTNEDMGQLATIFLGDSSLSRDEKGAALDYMESSLNLRGFNLAMLVQSRDEDGKPLQVVDEAKIIDNDLSVSYMRGHDEAYEDPNIINRLEKATEALGGSKNDVGFYENWLGGMTPAERIRKIIDDGASSEDVDAAIEYLNAKHACDGMLKRIDEDVDLHRELQTDFYRRATNADGNLQPVVLTNGEEVYVTSGNIVLTEDGTMVDKSASDGFITVFNPKTNKIESISPQDIKSIGKETSAEEITQIINTSAEQYGQTLLDKVNGQERPQEDAAGSGEVAQGAVMGADAQPRRQYGSGVIMIKTADGSLARGFLTGEKDEYGRNEYYMEHDLKHLHYATDEELDDMLVDYKPDAPEAEAPAEDVPADAPTDETEAADKKPIVDKEGYARLYEAGQAEAVYFDDPRLADEIEELQAKSDRLTDAGRGLLDGYLAEQRRRQESAGAVEQETPAETQPEVQSEVPAETPAEEQVEAQAASEANVDGSNEQIEAEATEEVVPMPIEKKTGEPLWAETTPERGHAYIFGGESELSRAEGKQFVSLKIEEAEKGLKKLKGKAPKIGTSLAKFKKEKADWEQKVASAHGALDYWNAVSDMQMRVESAEAAERRRQQIELTDAAIAQYEQEKAAAAQAEAERQAVGYANAMPVIKERYDAAEKIYGNEDVITLANGEQVKGRWVLSTPEATTPSHDPFNGYVMSEGFPLNANGTTVNDRDYQRDILAQRANQAKASDYDSRAIQNPVINSLEGVVLSGNDRDMAGKLAARAGSDAKYMEYLSQYCAKYGFTPEQVSSIPHARLRFELSEPMAYTTDNFAKFNAQEMKSQSNTETAVKMGKVVDDMTFRGIVRSISSFDTLGDFYNDQKAGHEAVGALITGGVIGSEKLPELIEGPRGQEKLTEQGKKMLEAVLIGKFFEGDPEAVRLLTEHPSMRQRAVYALSELADNFALGKGYSLEEEMINAVKLCSDALNTTTHEYGLGDKVSGFSLQNALFEEYDNAEAYRQITVMMLADLLNHKNVSELKKVITLYNAQSRESAKGQTGFDFDEDGNPIYGVRSKEEILKDVLNYLNYGSKQQIEEAQRAAIERRKADSIQQDGDVESGDRAGSAGATEAAGAAEVGERSERKYNISDGKGSTTTPLSADGRAETVREVSKAIADFARALGREVTYEGDFDGVNERGYVEDGVIHINPNMRAAEQAAFVLGHEFAHTLEGSEAYDALVDYIKGSQLMNDFLHKRTEQLRKQGSWKLTRDMTLEELEDYTKRLYKSNGHEITDEEATNEVIADFVSEEILSDQGRLEEFMREAPGARNIFQRLLDAIVKLFKQLTGKYNAELETLRDMLKKAIDVSEEFTREDGTRMFNLTTIDKTTAAAEKYMRKKRIPKKERERTIAELRNFAEMARELNDAKDENGDWKFPLFNAWNVKSIEVDENGIAHVTCVVKNAEYTMNIDFSTICKKRKNLDALLNALAAEDDFSIEGLQPEDIAEMNKIIKAHGLEIACGLCFVDAKRYNVINWSQSYAQPYNDMLRAISGMTQRELGEMNFGEQSNRKMKSKKFTPNWDALDELMRTDPRFVSINAEGEEVVKPIFAKARLLLEGRIKVKAAPSEASGYKVEILDEPNEALAEKARHFINAKDLVSSQGFDGLKESFPELFAISYSHQGTAKPKSSLSEVPYNGEIVAMAQRFSPDKAYGIGGVRNQSFSDFVAHMVFDYVQMYGDLAAKRLPLQAYTKEMAYARLFGQTGAKINMSALHTIDADTQRLIDVKFPKVKDKKGRIKPIPKEAKETDMGLRRVGLDANGNYVRNDESVDIDEAIALQDTDGYDGNVGIIVVGLSYEHTLKLMADPKARMVIPYHGSGINSNVAAVVGARYYTDYTDYQNTCDEDGRKVEKDYCRFNGRMKELEKQYHKGSAGWNRIPIEAAEEYVRECEEKGHRPKYPQFAYIINDGSAAVRYENGKPVNVEVGEDGKPKVREQYYKLLEDFSVYNSRGEYCPQGAVKLTFAEEMRVGDELPNSSRHGERVSVKEYICEMLADEQQNRDQLDEELVLIKEEAKAKLNESKQKRKYSIIGEQRASGLDETPDAEIDNIEPKSDGESMSFRERKGPAPRKTGVGYKVFYLKDGKLYPPMVANPEGEGTRTGVWLDADAAPIAGNSKTGRPKVKAGGKGTQGGSGLLAYRPGWHLGEIPYALQFNRGAKIDNPLGIRGKNGKLIKVGTYFPKDFVWAEVEYADDVDYQKEADANGYVYGKDGNVRMNADGTPIIIHSEASLDRMPENGSYRYRTNPNPATDPWIITGSMRVTKILTPSEVDAIVRAAGREPQKREAGALTDAEVGQLNNQLQKRLDGDPAHKVKTAEAMLAGLHTEAMIITDIEEVKQLESYKQSSEEMRERMLRSKGWYDHKTGQVVIAMPNNSNVEDVEQTVLHEVVAHKGIDDLLGGAEQANAFYEDIYDHLKEKERARVNEKMASSGYDRAKATKEYMGDLAEKDDLAEFDEIERSIWQKLKAKVLEWLDKILAEAGVKLPKWVKLGDNELRYLLWRSKKNLENHTEGDYVRKAEDIAKRTALKVGGDISFRAGETDDVWKDGSLGLEERITNATLRLSNNQSGDVALRNEAMRAVCDNLQGLLHDMRNRSRRATRFKGADAKVERGVELSAKAQRLYDQVTAKRVGDLARVLMQTGWLRNMTSGEMQRIVSALKNATGAEEIAGSVEKIMDIMIDNQVRIGKETLKSLMSIRGSKVDARGVEVQGTLDADGVRMMQSMRRGMALSEADLRNKIDEAVDRMGDSDRAIADDAALEYAGLQLALEYVEDITASKNEEEALRESIKEAKAEKDAGRIAADAYNQFVEATEDAIRKNKIERAEAYNALIGRLSSNLLESIENAKDWREAEKNRIREIQHNANSDMQGMPSEMHRGKETWKDGASNLMAATALAPLATFEQMIRGITGQKAADGESYIYNRLVRGLNDARAKEIRGYRDKLKKLGDKVKEVFSNSKENPKSWGDVIRLERKLPKKRVRYFDKSAGEYRESELMQGNLLYIYMVDKMSDGRMKLRKMGVTEEMVDAIADFLDPRLKALGDWLQEEFLVETRNEYNETHKRMFGTSMAAIDNYFPLKVLGDARGIKEDIDSQDTVEGATSTVTGAIKKRRTNTLALDILGADAFNVVLDHLAEMEHWNAYCELGRDMNALLSYGKFRNRVKNMRTIYGSGNQLWKRFKEVSRIAFGSYHQEVNDFDEGFLKVARGVTAAKVALRLNTALKQTLSLPAVIPDMSIGGLVEGLKNPRNPFAWCMENLPIFEERWRSRMSGDPRLMKSERGWNDWRNNVVEIAARVGMTPNAFIDAVICSIVAKTIYDTKLSQYIKDGYPRSKAEARAKQDASIGYNLSQQSSEGAYLAPIQAKKNWLSVMWTVFRNSPMSYTRQVLDSVRNLNRNLTPGKHAEQIEYMAKQILRDWEIDPEQATGSERAKAERAAKRRYRRALRRDALRLVTYGFVLPGLWSLGGYWLYMLMGDDDDEKQQMKHDIYARLATAPFEGLTGGDVLSNMTAGLITGTWNERTLSKDMPLTQDIAQMAKKLFKEDKTADAINDIFNLCVQSGIGLNPATIENMVLGIMDSCGNDVHLAHEATIVAARILNCPESQVKKLYFDEIGMSGEEASKLSPAEIAERYARMQIKLGRPITPWLWDDEDLIEKRMKGRYGTLAAAKERFDRQGDAAVKEAYAEYAERYKAVDKKMKAAKDHMEIDYEEGAEKISEVQNDPDFELYQRFRLFDKGLTKLSKMWIEAGSGAEASLISQAVEDYRAGMVKALRATSEAEQESALDELRDMIDRFESDYEQYKPQSKVKR